MIPPEAKPALAPKARLRFDRTSGGYLLLYPERGLALNATAANILKLCDGELTVDGIVEKLQGEYLDRSAEELRRDVLEFLEEMSRRGLVRVLE
ncbi:MAG: pyrroloquinoline quinone biosynthesis protein PqqD [Deltaproteobacteria bacterium 13_1_20CM_2_69_21]|nr:MAG: pyrroloquinoline quinone biosynthesis protein PqqD [Gemmatimonadetes bacterium 13_1_40CM_66_11]OLC75874.1 MAG: pyrroloquinoline quinone biosynthesis protein PqqD [Deltaproteobacteria bacterium 13_1_40CM_4_68_19]OLD45056.1 MAG: pyrroloquinoline quinone biosynthesis protein PqqD [Chloroflexi bacterium 13_1_40CM_2_68_14]OLE62850.1 MAG: pyrroloquinoline quinone biosynthesis protein PqqD [Deltaproteobacteria bacterium 13_1_20CM_2_69_21]